MLEAAWKLFLERVYDRVSLNAIAKEAGVSVQTVIRRFGSKERIFVSANDLKNVDYLGARDGVAAGDASGAVRTLFDQYEEVGDGWLHIMSQERRAKVISYLVERGREYHHRWVERVFGPLVKEAELRERRIKFAQVTVATDVYTWQLLRRDFGLEPEEVQKAAENLIERILA